WPSTSCEQGPTPPWPRSQHGPGSTTKASSPTTSSASSASRQVGSGRPQESPKSRKARQETGRQALYHSVKTEARVAESRRRNRWQARRIALGQRQESAGREHVGFGAG